MARRIKQGSTDVSVVIRIIDSTDGTPETGVVYNTSGIDLQYRREGATSVSITEATLAGLDSAHSDGGFLHIGNGYYRLDLPDAAVAAGATGVLIHGAVTGMVVIGEYVELVAYDPSDAVRLGLTALPNAAADAAGGLPISDAGGLDLDALNSNVSAILVDTAEIGAAGAGLTAIPWNASWDAEVQSECADALAAYDPPTKTEMDSGLAGLNDLDAAGIRSAVGLASANLDTQLAALPTAAENADAVWDESTTGHVTAGTFGEQVKTDIDAILTDTAEIGAAGAGLTALASAANLATVDTVVDAIKAVTDNLPDSGALSSLATAAAIDALPTAAENATAVLTTAMTESYSTKGQTKTVAQALYEIAALLGEKAVNDVTVTVKKVDGSSTAATYTLDSATAPTSIARAT